MHLPWCYVANSFNSQDRKIAQALEEATSMHHVARSPCIISGDASQTDPCVKIASDVVGLELTR
jgi:hypothetical protein